MASGDINRRLGIEVDATDNASGKLSEVKREVAGINSAGGVASSGFGGFVSKLESGAGRIKTAIGGAVSHAKAQLGSLATFGLGALGIGGLLSGGAAIEQSLSKAQDWGLQIEKLQGITHDTAVELSGLMAVTEKYGLADERLAQIAGFTEKSLGALTAGSTNAAAAHLKLQQAELALTKAQEKVNQLAKDGKTHTLAYRSAVLSLEAAQQKVAGDKAGGGSKAAQFLKTYGFNILDTSGKVKSFSTLLLSFADYWKKGAETPAIKAAAAAKLFGRGYADLVPILNLGSAGIQEAQQEAQALGLTLTQDNVVALSKAREATRQWGDAVGGLKLQLGLALLPTLTDLSTAATTFVEGHRDQIISFFKDAIAFGRQAAGTIANLASSLIHAWDSIPSGLRDLMLKAFIADKAISWTFGFSPLKLALDAGSGLLAGLGKSVATSVGSALVGSKIVPQHVWVDNMGPGGLNGGGGPAGPAEDAGVSLLDWVKFGAAAATVGGGIVAGGLAIKDWFNQQLNIHPIDLGQVIQNPFAPLTTQQAQAYVGAAPSYTGGGTKNLGFLGGGNKAAPFDFEAGLYRTADAVNGLTAVMRDAPWLKKLEASWQKAGQTMHDKIKAAMADLDAGNNVGAAAKFLGGKLGNAGFGAGGYDAAVKVLDELKALNSKDPAIAAAIKELTGRLPRLATDKKDLAAAVAEANSNDPKNAKLDKLNAIESDLRAHGDRTTQSKVSDLISAVKHERTNVNVHVSIAPETVYMRVAGRTIATATTRFKSANVAGPMVD